MTRARATRWTGERMHKNSQLRLINDVTICEHLYLFLNTRTLCFHSKHTGNLHPWRALVWRWNDSALLCWSLLIPNEWVKRVDISEWSSSQLLPLTGSVFSECFQIKKKRVSLSLERLSSSCNTTAIMRLLWGPGKMCFMLCCCRKKSNTILWIRFIC